MGLFQITLLEQTVEHHPECAVKEKTQFITSVTCFYRSPKEAFWVLNPAGLSFAGIDGFSSIKLRAIENPESAKHEYTLIVYYGGVDDVELKVDSIAKIADFPVSFVF
ncbi:hypothetical protein QT972_22705 [Microcoleus sp. herbarium7]|uniref:hypothetical protein n=1 Tax=Microcoleus sp. herbarium7 TaxID=3055435 RepID=UPI002FD66962